MRSLEYWTKYLEQQEEELRRALEQRTASERPSRAAAEPDAAPGRQVDTVRLQETAVGLRKQLRRRSPAGDGRRQEVAQRSYKRFRETREEFLERLLDPQLTLEDAARILNVCPTTVRRYTNKGLLKHHRTAGNQRRFRLSDVLAFLQSQSGGEEAAD